jgi:uncharacterized protein (TIGR02302 family)
VSRVVIPGLRRRRWLARGALLFEQLWRALWPPLGVLGLFVLVALLDLPALLPPWLHLSLLLAIAVLALGLLARGLRRLRLPDVAAADRRIERASGLAHRPLSVLHEGAVQPETAALWQAHQALTLRRLRRLRSGWPHPGLAARDPRALRAGLIVALVAALVIAGPEAPARLARALQPGVSLGLPAAARVQAWITPPAYTHLPPVFLGPESATVRVPAGSHLTISLTGSGTAPDLRLAGQRLAVRALDAESFEADLALSNGGRLAVRHWWHEIAAWQLDVVANAPPSVRFTALPGPAPHGLALRLPWQVTDAYGVASLAVEFHLRDRPSAPPFRLPIPLPGGSPTTAQGLAEPDLTANPWAGLPVIAQLTASDTAGLVGVSEAAGLRLPERQFHNPVAQVAVAVRRSLSLLPEQRAGALAQLNELTDETPLFDGDAGAWLNLSGIIHQLRFDRAPEAIPAVQERLWQLALQMEEGRLARTARALDAARQALRDALDRAAQPQAGKPPDQATLDTLMQQLQQALDANLRALTDQARRQERAPSAAARAAARQAQQAAQAMHEAIEHGQLDAARQQMAQLDRSLQAMREEAQHPGARQQAEQQQRGQQQMSALQDLVQRQGGLLDRLQQRSRRVRSPLSQPGALPYGQSPWQLPPDVDTSPQHLAQQEQASHAAQSSDEKVQHALRRALGELMQQFGDLSGKVPPSLGAADQAMQGAADALVAGDDEKAGEAEQEALAALQKGGGEMRRQLAEAGANRRRGQGRQSGQQGQGEPGMGEGLGEQDPGAADGQGGAAMSQGQGENAEHGRRDPFGRLTQEGASGSDESSDMQVLDHMERARSQAIENELRQREGERSRPQPELDYIERLLKQF